MDLNDDLTFSTYYAINRSRIFGNAKGLCLKRLFRNMIRNHLISYPSFFADLLEFPVVSKKIVSV